GKGVKPADIGNITRLVNSAVRNLLKDSTGEVALELLPGDIALIQKVFAETLAQKDGFLRSKWSGAQTFPGTADGNLQLIYNVNGTNAIVAITGYKPYLAQKILPQSFFAMLLLIVFLAAFVLAYRNLKRQLQLGEIKNGLISNMSHELKTPVSIVKVALEAMDDYDIINNPTQAREYIQMAKLETNRLEMLINKTLNTSLLEQGRITLEREPTNIVILIREIIESLKLRLLQDDACINLHTEGADFILNIDKLHVQGVMLNILDNSIKYGGPSVKIDIHVIAGEATLTIHITDNGAGIPEKYRELVFEKFFRIPTGDRHNIQGYGLGLNYVKQVMQLHEGMSTVSNIPGGGCRFTLQFFKNR
ncbi:MAG: HAMP domain-containing histidine kinase, partial [Taibaiella sp.]|nr:HAMP domain-containing histidine kinase [Taibaiella sp.]